MNKRGKKENKTVTLNMRVTKRMKAALHRIGDRESRNLVNTLEWLVVDYHRRNNIPMPEGNEIK